ncbi:helix-turn-helix domain-containing protein [Flavobacterium algicola]|uniref:helix-turn-helix domain-containing protein n=1 Tax=Flavobacterium algicola TaxID=556529 RepID=UPI001EFE2E66|nr:helix-turn-helix transcriptional regulator [Flavobacterium algicola]MCG9792514.1 helix-turn-helix domain-containing protein [Flavobacterium algicola]
MNALEIKENRKKMNLTQAQLAIKLGVSLKTVSNYEKGEVIPETKQELLRFIFNKESNNTLNEPSEFYTPNSNVEKKLMQVFEKIKHHQEIINLLNEQAEIITNANAEKAEDDEILKKFK